jgi:hypothetical protein
MTGWLVAIAECVVGAVMLTIATLVGAALVFAVGAWWLW